MFFAIHKRTKEHRVIGIDTRFGAKDWRYVEADADGWIPWDGGNCPLPETQKHEVRVVTGGVFKREKASSTIWWGGTSVVAYRPILDAKPEAPAWDGEGLPPVGIKCLGNYTHGATRRWLEVEILRHSSGGKECAVFVPEINALGWCNTFRPIRSAEEKAVEELARILSQLPMNSSNKSDLASYLYRAIREGKVPGVQLTGGEP